MADKMRVQISKTRRRISQLWERIVNSWPQYTFFTAGLHRIVTLLLTIVCLYQNSEKKSHNCEKKLQLTLFCFCIQWRKQASISLGANAINH